MTDTTDVATLIKSAMLSCAEAFCMEISGSMENDLKRDLTESECEQVSDAVSGLLHSAEQLEAERRKGDLWFGKVADLEAALKAERQRADALQTERDEFRRRLKIERSILEDADKELAALKGDQVPVALVDERRGSGGFCLTQYGRRLNLQHGTELFTAPQKPVVLHDHANSDLVFSYKCPGCGSRPVIKHAGDCTHYNVETVEESEPAGGIVKDGE